MPWKNYKIWTFSSFKNLQSSSLKYSHELITKQVNPICLTNRSISPNCYNILSIIQYIFYSRNIHFQVSHNYTDQQHHTHALIISLRSNYRLLFVRLFIATNQWLSIWKSRKKFQSICLSSFWVFTHNRQKIKL